MELFILRSKGQTISLDFLVSVIIFIVFMLLLIPVISNIESDFQDQKNRRFMETKIITVSDLLLKTPGYPENWNDVNVESIGLVTGEQLNGSKMMILKTMGYDRVRSIIGLSGTEFYMNFTNYKNEPVFFNGIKLEYGNSDISGNYVYKIKRLSVMNDTIIIMNLVIWR